MDKKYPADWILMDGHGLSVRENFMFGDTRLMENEVRFLVENLFFPQVNWFIMLNSFALLQLLWEESLLALPSVQKVTLAIGQISQMNQQPSQSMLTYQYVIYPYFINRTNNLNHVCFVGRVKNVILYHQFGQWVVF